MDCEAHASSVCRRGRCFCAAVFGTVIGGVLLAGVALKLRQRPEPYVPIRDAPSSEFPIAVRLGETPSKLPPVEMTSMTGTPTAEMPMGDAPEGKTPVIWKRRQVTPLRYPRITDTPIHYYEVYRYIEHPRTYAYDILPPNNTRILLEAPEHVEDTIIKGSSGRIDSEPSPTVEYSAEQSALHWNVPYSISTYHPPSSSSGSYPRDVRLKRLVEM